MAALPIFALYDRVRITESLEAIPAMTPGTVVRAFLAPQYYEIWFDGTDGPRVVRAAALELMEQVTPAPQVTG